MFPTCDCAIRMRYHLKSCYHLVLLVTPRQLSGENVALQTLRSQLKVQLICTYEGASVV